MRAAFAPFEMFPTKDTPLPQGKNGWVLLLDEMNSAAKAVQAAMAEATKNGTISESPYGVMSYRLYGKRDRIQLLWVLSVPGATTDSIGVSTVSQRENALEGRGQPWLMLAGTPGAHIMIPINK